jgi:hypothetical protein
MVISLLELDRMMADLLSVHLGEKRETVKAWRDKLRTVGTLSTDERVAIVKLHRRKRKQIALVEEAREKARQTRGRRLLGLTVAEVERRVAERKGAQDDLGF